MSKDYGTDAARVLPVNCFNGKALDTSFSGDLAEIELLIMDRQTKVRDFEQAMCRNEVYYHLFQN